MDILNHLSEEDIKELQKKPLKNELRITPRGGVMMTEPPKKSGWYRVVPWDHPDMPIKDCGKAYIMTQEDLVKLDASCKGYTEGVSICSTGTIRNLAFSHCWVVRFVWAEEQPARPKIYFEYTR